MNNLPSNHIICAPWGRDTTELRLFVNLHALHVFFDEEGLDKASDEFICANIILSNVDIVRIIFTAKDKPVIQEVIDNAFKEDMLIHIPTVADWYYFPKSIDPATCLPLVDKFTELFSANKKAFTLHMHNPNNDRNSHI